MGKVIAIVNQKGGVGKTTTSVSLSAALAILGKRVLLVDSDPQGNATSGLGVEKKSLSSSIYDIIINQAEIENVGLATEYGLDIVPSHIDLAGAEVELVAAISRESRLKKAIDKVKNFYDYIIIDCPPSLGLLTLNSLVAADSVLMPVQCEYYALEGLGQLMQTIDLVRNQLNESLEVEGVLMTMYDSRTRLAEQVVDDVRSHFGDKVYETLIPRNIRLSEAPSYGQPIFAYESNSKGAEAYMRLAQEVIAGE